MADEIVVKVEGLEQLQRDFKFLASKIEPKSLQPLLKQEAKGFAVKLLPLTPQGPTGNLRRGVKAWAPGITKRKPEAMARAGIRYRIAPHAQLVEYGTMERHTKGGAYRGKSPARNFITPLADKEMPGMLKRIIKAIEDAIDRAWK